MATTSNTNILSIDKVTKLFGSKKVLDNVTLKVKKGEIFGFLGPNGAGKTTTIRIVLDVLRPHSGQVTLFGMSSRDVDATHARIGYLSGDMKLDEDLTGKQYLNFVSHTFKGTFDARITELADLLDINLNTKIEHHSRGNKQKVSLIAAFMHRPELLILDEPTSGFDPLIQEKFIHLINEFKLDGGTVFMSSHELSEVQQLCDRMAFIRNGSIVGTRTISELATSTTKRIKVTVAEPQVEHIITSAKSVPGLKLLDTSGSILTFSYNSSVRKLLSFFSSQNIQDITIKEPELEEIFLEFYKNDTSGKVL